MSASHSCSCQQFELYGAEAPISRQFGRLIPAAELQRYVDDLRDLPYWERNFEKVLRVDCFVRKTDRSGSVGAWHEHRNAGQIEMAPCHLTELYILHEVSHVLAAARYGSHAHCPWFARTYLELVYSKLGGEASTALLAAFDAAGVDHDTRSAVPAGVEL